MHGWSKERQAKYPVKWLETLNKISNSLKGRQAWNKGLTKENNSSLLKSSEKQKNKKLSLEHRVKIGNSEKREKHWNWKGGISYNPYTIEWSMSLKKEIRNRDNNLCQICSKTAEHVHHIDYDKENSAMMNLISLCASCHGKTNYNRDQWINYFNNLRQIAT